MTNQVTIELEIPEIVRRELVENCDKRHRLIVGGRGKAASWSIARILLWKGMSKPLFFPCVREVQKTIKHSVKKLLEDTIRANNLGFFYRSYDQEIRGINGTLFTFHGLQEFNADNIKSLEGADDCWIAEAQCIARRSLSILRPTIRKPGSVLWYDFNPRYETDPVWIDYVVNKDPYAKVLFMSWRDNPWFPESLMQEKESDYARNPIEAEHIWEGVLRNMGDLYVCPSGLVDIAINNHIEKPTMNDLCVGADIAHQGGDKIVFYCRKGEKVINSYKSRYQSVPETVQHLKGFVMDKSIPINIDNGHVGAAVADYMEKDGYLVNRINFGGVPCDTEHYEDIATEMYFNLRDLLENIDIPNDHELRSQLIQRKYKYINGRRGYEVMKIESKKEFKEHAVLGSNSPDESDALTLCFYTPQANLESGTLNHSIY